MLLPKGYLSWSQISTWQKSKKQYRDRYYLNIPVFETEYLRYGKYIGEMLENRTPSTPEEEEICAKIPDALLKEQKYEFEVDGVPVIAYFDAETPKGIHEYKTSVNPWTQDKVDTHGQLDLYVLGYKLKHGKLPEEVKLYYIPTQKTGRGVLITGEVEEFDYVPNELALMEMHDLITTTAEEISKDYARFLEDRPLDLVPIQEVVKFQRQLSDLEKIVKQKKAELKEWLVTNDLTDFSNEDVTIFYQTRKKYEYSEEVKNLEQRLKALKKDEEETAECVETKTLVVKVK